MKQREIIINIYIQVIMLQILMKKTEEKVIIIILAISL